MLLLACDIHPPIGGAPTSLKGRTRTYEVTSVVGRSVVLGSADPLPWALVDQGALLGRRAGRVGELVVILHLDDHDIGSVRSHR